MIKLAEGFPGCKLELFNSPDDVASTIGTGTGKEASYEIKVNLAPYEPQPANSSSLLAAMTLSSSPLSLLSP